MGTTARRPQGGRDYPTNWHQFHEWFATEERCFEYLERVRWGDTFVCPHCFTVDAKFWRMSRGRRRCAECRGETAVTRGTIFHGTRLPLRTGFAAIWYVVEQKNGVSALGLQRTLGFGSYQTAAV